MEPTSESRGVAFKRYIENIPIDARVVFKGYALSSFQDANVCVGRCSTCGFLMLCLLFPRTGVYTLYDCRCRLGATHGLIRMNVVVNPACDDLVTVNILFGHGVTRIVYPVTVDPGTLEVNGVKMSQTRPWML